MQGVKVLDLVYHHIIRKTQMIIDRNSYKLTQTDF